MKEKDCICNELEEFKEISGFKSAYHYKQFEEYILSLIEKKELLLVSYERDWFWGRRIQCAKCNQIWILTEPDFPFKGYWGKIEWIR